VLDPAVALGGDCLADLAVVRPQPELFGQVASGSDLTPARSFRATSTGGATSQHGSGNPNGYGLPIFVSLAG